jgi:hypothetical protein
MRDTTKHGKSDATPITSQARASPLEDADSRTKLVNGCEPKPTLISPPIVETGFVELEDGSLVEMIEDPDNPSRTLFSLFKDGEVRFIDQLKCGERILRPIPRESEIVRHVRLPRGVEHYQSLASLLTSA